MEEIGIVIAENIKKIRKDRKLSLDTLAEITGVSKSMLGQIERGESSPTISTLWKIATGLHISFTTLVEDNRDETRIVSNKDIVPLQDEMGLVNIFPVFPYDENKRFEILYMEISGGACSKSLPHEEGTEEYVVVYEGALTVDVDGAQYCVKAENSICYRADKPHCYKNEGTEKTKLCMIIYYKK